MPGRGWATELLGREVEQGELYEALSLALKGDHQFVVVAGDAGAGKTTLIDDVARRAEDFGYTVAVGHCVDIEAGISFGPVVEALATLLATVEVVDSRPVARRMRAFLDPETPSSVEQRDLLEDLRQVFLEAADSGPVLLVLEDLHWADISTRDLVVALSRTARGRLLMVVSVRTDDLHRRNPARKVLAEIARATGGRRVELGPLDRASIAGIVASVSGRSPDPVLVRSVLERSGGNPLYAEEIAAAGPGAIPDQLSDLFLARVDALADGPRELVRTASVDGSRVDSHTLMEVAGLKPAELNGRLRDLVDANVLRHIGDALEFRHGLLREAVYKDLLPDERARLHAGFAVTLQARAAPDSEPGLGVLSRLAFHWYAAHDLPRTLESSVRAGLAAKKVRAAEEVTHFERALSVWDRVPDAEAWAGRTRIETTVMLGEATRDQGDQDGWYRQVRRAVDAIEPTTDPLVASRAYSALGLCAFWYQDPLGPEEAIRRALEYAGNEPTEELAWALAAHTELHLWNNRTAPGLAAAEEAIEAAKVADCIEPLVKALRLRNIALLTLGRVNEARAGAEEAISVARTAGFSGAARQNTEWLAFVLIHLGGETTRGMSLAQAAYEEALDAGLLVSAAGAGASVANGLINQGRFDEAELLLADLRELGLREWHWRNIRARLSFAQGDVDGARLVMPRLEAEVFDGHQPNSEDVLLEVQVAALCGDNDRCLEVARWYLGLLGECDSPIVAANVARVGLQALAVQDTPSDHQSAPLRQQATFWLDRARDGLTDQWRVSDYGVDLAMTEGYAARIAGEPGVEQFREAARLAEPLGDFFALEPRLDLAQELLAHGGRDEGRELLVDCWTEAHDMGARGLERRAHRIATRTRVPLPDSASSQGPLSRLTPREREVLEHLARGSTNKTIAAELVISDKTVRAHVSNVLAKLNVANRGAAAALARSLQ